jgi:phosphohistidine phosphatase SixA
VVRHAEKACEDCLSCGLSPEGNARALALRDLLATLKIDTIITSECLRTQLTAKPLADYLHKHTGTYETTALETFISTLHNIGKCKHILIVSHSNQATVIVEALSGQKVSIGDDDYNKLFIITRNKTVRSAHLEEMRYSPVSQQ